MPLHRLALPLLLLPLACAPPPAEHPSALRLGLVIDSTIFKIIEAFQVHAVKATTSTGVPVTCPEIPSSYRPEEPPLVPLITPVGFAWTGSTEDARSPVIQVPSGEKMVIVVKGLTRYANGVQTVAQGCEGDLSFDDGAKEEVAIDVKATIGAPCATQLDCEKNLLCHRAQHFANGYCTKVGCVGDTDCPPGSRCITDAETGNICLRVCEAAKDCDTSTQDCVGRLGPTAKGCASVCVWPLWNPGSECKF